MEVPKVPLSDHIDLSSLQLERKENDEICLQSANDDYDPEKKTEKVNDDISRNPLVAASHSLSNTSSTVDASSLPTSSSLLDVRVAVVGNVDCGKSTIIGVLTGGSLDNGRGLARSRVFLHVHESSSGRTSCISQHIMGYSGSGEPVFNSSTATSSALMKTKSWQSVIQQSSHIVTFIDLAGHEKYLKTTISGLTGCFADYAMVLINSLAGITKMTKEHLGVVLALQIPLIVVVTKIDLVPENVLARTKQQLWKVLRSTAVQRLPVQMRNSKDVEFVLDKVNRDNCCPVFFVSCVAGTHIALLHEYLSKLPPRRERWMKSPISIPSNLPLSQNVDSGSSQSSEPSSLSTSCEYVIDETFLVSGVGIVVSGTVQSGSMRTNSTLLLGPYSDGSFRQVIVRTLHSKRQPVEQVFAGDSCAVSLRSRKEHLSRSLIRRGMYLVDPLLDPQATFVFEAEVHILHHPTTIKAGYQAVIHASMVRQAATLVAMVKINDKGEKEGELDCPVSSSAPISSSGEPSHSHSSLCLRTGDRALARFRFLLRPEYLHVDTSFIFREGSTKGIGRITRVKYSKEEQKALLEQERGGRHLHSKGNRSAESSHLT